MNTTKTESRYARFKKWCSNFFANAKESTTKMVGDIKEFVKTNPMFSAITTVFIVLCAISPAFFVTFVILGLYSGIAYFWIHCVGKIVNVLEGVPNA